MTDKGNFGWYGAPESDELNRNVFLIRQELGRVRTTHPVKVVAVHGGGLTGPPTVDVQYLVHQTDGQGNSTPHDTIYGILAPRSGNANYQVICDPKVGDLGQISVCDRDISSVKANAAAANPGSYRRFDPSDAIYHGGVWSGANPTQYIMFTDAGVTIVDKFGNTIVTSNGRTTVTTPIFKVVGEIQATGNVTAGQGGGDQVDMQNHKHGKVITGTDETDVPVPGT